MSCTPDNKSALEALRREFPHWGILVLGHGPGSWVGVRGKEIMICASGPVEIRAKLRAAHAHHQHARERAMHRPRAIPEPPAEHPTYGFPIMSYSATR